MCGKNLFIAIVLLLATSAVYAQGAQDNVTATAVVDEVFPHFTHTVVTGGTNVVSSRLIAKTNTVYKGGAFQPVDSSVYTYYSTRGGTPDLEEPNKDSHIMFDESITYNFNKTLGVYENLNRRTQQFDANDNVTILTYQEWRLTDMNWKNKERYVYDYDNGKMKSSTLEQWYGVLWQKPTTSTLTYSGNNVVTVKSHTYSISFSYTGNNLTSVENKVMSSTNVWHSTQRRTYQYYANTTDVSEYVLEVYDVNSQTWNNSKKWEYTYNSAGRQRTTTEYFWDGAWRPKYQTYFTYNTGGNVVLKVMRDWDVNTSAFENYKKEEWAYNTYGQPTEIKSFTWDNIGYTHHDDDIYVRYYYEGYNPNTINDVLVADDINIFPSPANNVLNISAELEDKQSSVYLGMINMSGQVVYQQIIQSSNKLDHSIRVSDMPSGNYMLYIAVGNNKATRQVVVAH